MSLKPIRMTAQNRNSTIAFHISANMMDGHFCPTTTLGIPRQKRGDSSPRNS